MKNKKRKNLSFNITKLYSIIALFFFVGAIFFGSTKLFLAEDIPINQTPLNEELDLRSDGKLTINKWVYDKSKEKMEIILITNGMKDYKSELSFSSVTREETDEELPLEVVYNDNDIYVIEINDVKNGFKQLALRLHKSNKNLEESFDDEFIKEDKEDELFSTIYTDERMVEKEVINKKDTSDYIIEITDNLIEDTQNDVKDEEKSIDNKEYTIEEIKKEIEELEDDLLYETVDEQVETSNKIDNLNKDIDNYEKEISDNEANIKNLEAKIKRLDQRKKELKLGI